MIEKTIAVMLLSLLCLTGCSYDVQRGDRIETETVGTLTFTYRFQNGELFTKTVYNETTKITTEYTYFYASTMSENASKMVVLTFDDSGNIIDEYTTLDTEEGGE